MLSKYDPKLCAVAAECCKEGATDHEVAQSLGIGRATLFRWRAEHPEFAEACRTAKEHADSRVEQALYARALGYSHPAVKILVVDGEVRREPFVEHYPPDTSAAIFWLKNRQPDRWRDLAKIEHTGRDGGAIEIATSPAQLAKLGKEKLAQMEALLLEAEALNGDDPKA